MLYNPDSSLIYCLFSGRRIQGESQAQISASGDEGLSEALVQNEENGEG